MELNYKTEQSENKIYITRNIYKALISDLNKLDSDKKFCLFTIKIFTKR